MRLSYKALARVVSALLLLCTAQSAVGSLYDGKYGQYATFDVWRTQVNCLTQGATCGVYNFTTPYIAPFGDGVRAVWAAGDYMQFVRGVGSSGPVGDLNYPNVQLIQYTSWGGCKNKSCRPMAMCRPWATAFSTSAFPLIGGARVISCQIRRCSRILICGLQATPTNG